MNASAKELAANFDLEKLTPEFYDDPYPTYRALRENEPVKRMPNGAYFLTRYDDLVTAYKNTKTFSSDKKKEFSPKYGNSLLFEHVRRTRQHNALLEWHSSRLLSLMVYGGKGSIFPSSFFNREPLRG